VKNSESSNSKYVDYKQLYGALFIIGWNIFWTSAICAFIKYVLRIPLRMSDEMLMIGDDAIHGEEAYAFYGEGERNLLYSDLSRTPGSRDVESGMGTMPVFQGKEPPRNGDGIAGMSSSSNEKND